MGGLFVAAHNAIQRASLKTSQNSCHVIAKKCSKGGRLKKDTCRPEGLHSIKLSY